MPIDGLARVRDVMGDLVLYHVRCSANSFGAELAPAETLSLFP